MPKSPRGGQRVLMSCFYDGDPPVSFNWTDTLATRFAYRRYKLAMIIHGECIKYALAANPAYRDLLTKLHGLGVKMRICDLCLTQAGYARAELLPFVRPVPYSIDYIIQQETRHGAAVIYDAQVARAGAAALP